MIATDVQTILVNWRHADRVLNVPIQHAVTSERSSGYIIAATTDYDEHTDPVVAEEELLSSGDFMWPRAWRINGRTWTLKEREDSSFRGASNLLAPEERKLTNSYDLPGKGYRVRADIFQIAYLMLVRKLIGRDFNRLLACIDGEAGLARIASLLFAKDVLEGRVHVADVRFDKDLGNRKREQRVREGERVLVADRIALGSLMNIASNAYDLDAEIAAITIARLLSAYGAKYIGCRGHDLARSAFDWRYHRKEEPGKRIRLLTDLGPLHFGDLGILLATASMAQSDKYLGLIRRRISGFQRGSRPSAGRQTVWHATAFYNPSMVERMATIFRFYPNFMLTEGEYSGKPKGERRTPAIKLGLARGKVYTRDLLRFR